MRRYTFYLLVAVLAFEIGSIVVFKLYWNTQNDLLKVQLTEQSKVEIVNNSLENKKIKKPEFIEIAFKNLPCEDEKLKPFWNELSDRTVSINTDYLERIKDCSDLIEYDYLVGSKNDGQVDLNNDGQKEIFIRSHVGYFCGNNCQVFWVFQKDNEKGYRKLFEQMGYMTIVENKKTNGYKDIRFEVYASYVYIDQKLYKFNGTEYVPKKCWSESKLHKNKAGELVESKRYRTEYHECKETEWVEWN
jgi:hypothetical protein